MTVKTTSQEAYEVLREEMTKKVGISQRSYAASGSTGSAWKDIQVARRERTYG